MTDKWIEIDTAILRSNLNAIKEKVKKPAEIMAVIKNEAYGHGLIETAHFYENEGIRYFAVTWADEGSRLRKAGIKGEILILAPIEDKEDIDQAIADGLILTCGSISDLEKVSNAAVNAGTLVKVHLKIETGLSRFGFIADDELLSASTIIKRHPEIQVEAVYTHMSDAGNDAFTKTQYEIFMKKIEILKKEGLGNLKIHCANSGIFLKHPEWHHDFVRLGTLLCGQYPVGNFPHPFSLLDPYCYKTRINSIRNLTAGATLGYKHTYTLKKAAAVAVIPVGYSDGLNLSVNNPNGTIKDTAKKMLKAFLMEIGINRFQQKVRIGNKYYPIRGKVFMQMALVELPENSGVKPGDVAVVPVSKTLAGKEIQRIFV